MEPWIIMYENHSGKVVTLQGFDMNEKAHIISLMVSTGYEFITN